METSLFKQGTLNPGEIYYVMVDGYYGGVIQMAILLLQ